GVVFEVDAPPHRAFHGAGDDRAVPPLEEQLRRRRDHHPVPGVDEGPVAARLCPGQPPVEGGRVAAERGTQEERVVDLVDVTGADALADGGQRGGVLYMRFHRLPLDVFIWNIDDRRTETAAILRPSLGGTYATHR